MSRRLQFAVLFAMVALLALPVSTSAQSCALCYTQAASAAAKFIAALKSGILILIIPPMFMSVGITYLAYRKRNQFRSSDKTDFHDGW